MKRVLSLAAIAALATAAHADPLGLAAAGTLQVTGVVTPDSGSPLSQLVRNFNNNNNNRYNAEYDLSSLAGTTITSATIAFDINVFQSQLSGSMYDFRVYAADGALNFASDWEPAGAIVVGSGSVAQNMGGSFSLNAAAAMQAILDANPGLTHIGFQVNTLPNSRALNTVQNLSFDATAIPAPASAAMLGLGGLAASRRRR